MCKFLLLFIFCLFFPSVLLAQSGPLISYALPAGGQRGTTFRVLLGGRQLLQAEEVFVSGEGVTARILKRFPKFAMNNAETSDPTRQFWREEIEVLRAPENEREGLRLEMLWTREQREASLMKTEEGKAFFTVSELCEKYPFFEEVLNSHTPEAVQTLYYEYLSERPDRKPKETMNQGLELEVTIQPEAPCGTRWLMLRGANGQKSAPLVFQVGDIPEVQELEPNDTPELPKRWNRKLKKMESWAMVQLPPSQLPVLFNGRIRAGDTDQFRFVAQKGQQLVLSVVGRFLNPYLADAVPGWFQPVIKVYTPEGREAGNAYCWKNDPDPTLIFSVPEDGIYTVEIQDSLFRGRDDFVYRLAVGEIPFVTSIYPPCAQAGKPFEARVEGVNLPSSAKSETPELADCKKIQITPPIDCAPNQDGTPIATLREVGGKALLRPISFTVEKEEPHEAIQGVQDIVLPSVFYGRLEQKGKPAEFRFHGKEGEKVSIEVTAGALDSTLDARLELLDEEGKTIAVCDDRAGCDGPNIGWRTHHADPLLGVTLPKEGTFIIRLQNTLYEDNPSAIYRIRLAHPEPDFLVFSSVPSVTFTGATEKVELDLVRLGGWDGPVEIISTVPGLRIDGGVFQPGVTHLVCTLTVNEKFWPKSLKDAKWEQMLFDQSLPIRARGTEGEVVVEREIQAAVRREQAFIYFHLIPTGTFLANFRGRSKTPFEIVTDLPVTLNLDGSETEIQFCPEKMKSVAPKSRKDWGPVNRWFTLDASCEGIELVSQQDLKYRQVFKVRVTDPEKAAKCHSLIFNYHWFKSMPEQILDGKTPPPDVNIQKVPSGWLPAVPIK